MNIQQYWNKVREASERLPEEVTLMSLDNADKGTHAGAVSVCPRDIAARRLVEGTHRIATEAEISNNKAVEETRLEKSRAREQRRDPRRVVFTDELVARLGGAASRTAPAK